jgi:oligopeptide/dipeptide ABC transporter ATP-binding protein
MDLLRAEGLQIQFAQNGTRTTGVADISFKVQKGHNLALVGESGCGKSVSALACMRLLGRTGSVTQGSITFNDQDITHASEKVMGKLRGAQMAMIFQEPMTSLNPLLTIGFQIREAVLLHTELHKKEAETVCLSALQRVGFPDPAKTLKSYPHELSGGMRQRAMIAMALACEPQLLIADEPTTALDVTMQAQILDLIKDLQQETGVTVLIITHDFGVVAEIAEEVLVVYAGLVVEQCSVRAAFQNPLHPYTEGLLKSIIPIDASMETVLHSIPGFAAPASAEPRGCPFYPRCRYGNEACQGALPELTERSPGHFVRCFITR